MDAVSTVLPGVAVGSATDVDADAPPGDAAFPAAFEQALAQPAGTSTGNAPPAAAGRVLPAQPVAAATEPGPIALSGAPVAPDGLLAHAGQVAPTASAVAAVVDALDDIAAGQSAVPAAIQPATPAPAGKPVAKTTVVDPATLAAAGTGAPSTDLDPGQTQAATQSPVPQSIADTAHKPARRPVVAEPAVAGAPPGELQLAIVAIATAAAGAAASASATAPAADSGRAGNAAPRTAEHPLVSAPVLAGGSEAALAAQAATGPDPTALSTTVPGNELAAAMLVPGAPRAAAADRAPALELPLAAAPGSPQFRHELGERLLWLVREGVHEARLQLNPRDLGPIEVRLGISDGAAQVSFSAQHAGTAAAVQQSLPQLREMLAQQGLQLGQAEVSQQQPGAGQQTPQQERSAAGDARGPGGPDIDAPVIGERVRVIGRGLVDAYA